MSTDNTITGLRSALFETLRELKAGTLDLDRAKAINETAQVIVNTAKAEVDFMKATGAGAATDFIPSGLHALPSGATPTATGIKTVRQVPGGNVTTHRMK